MLGLNLSTATVTKTNAGVVAINGALLGGSKVGVVGVPAPRRTLDLVFFEPSVPVGPYLTEGLNANQRVEPSKRGPGFAVTFSLDGFECGATASRRDGMIETLFCAAANDDDKRS